MTVDNSLFWDAILVKYSGIFTPAYAAYAIKFATAKVVTPTWGMIFLRGIGCNLLVCFAVWQASKCIYLLEFERTVPKVADCYDLFCFFSHSQLPAGAREIVSKIIALWIPIFIFVALGFDHVVANMYYIPWVLLPSISRHCQDWN